MTDNSCSVWIVTKKKNDFGFTYLKKSCRQDPQKLLVLLWKKSWNNFFITHENFSDSIVMKTIVHSDSHIYNNNKNTWRLSVSQNQNKSPEEKKNNDQPKVLFQLWSKVKRFEMNKFHLVFEYKNSFSLSLKNKINSYCDFKKHCSLSFTYIEKKIGKNVLLGK